MPSYKTVIEDKQALRAQLLQWSEIDTLIHIPVSYGSPIAKRAHAWCRVNLRGH